MQLVYATTCMKTKDNVVTTPSNDLALQLTHDTQFDYCIPLGYLLFVILLIRKFHNPVRKQPQSAVEAKTFFQTLQI